MTAAAAWFHVWVPDHISVSVVIEDDYPDYAVDDVEEDGVPTGKSIEEYYAQEHAYEVEGCFGDPIPVYAPLVRPLPFRPARRRSPRGRPRTTRSGSRASPARPAEDESDPPPIGPEVVA